MMTFPIETEAVWFTGPRQVAVQRERVSAPEPGQVLIAALASAISHGTELLVYRGHVAPTLPLDLPTLSGSFAFPIKYGYASVGRVLAVGAGITHLHVGDLVFALHPHQQAYLAPVEVVTRLPDGIDPLVGVFFANCETALTIVHDAAPRLGETVVVFGQGVVGLLTTQLLVRAGVRVLAVDPDPHRRAVALDSGAAAALIPGPDLPDAVRAQNTGRLADLAVEVSGVPEALQGALDCVVDEGTVVVASWYGQKAVTLDLGAHFHRGRLRLCASQVGRLTPATAPRWTYARRNQTVASLLPHLRLAELISHTLPLTEAARAYALVDAGDPAVLQVVLRYDE